MTQLGAADRTVPADRSTLRGSSPSFHLGTELTENQCQCVFLSSSQREVAMAATERHGHFPASLWVDGYRWLLHVLEALVAVM